MIIHADFQIIKPRDKRFDIILHKPYLERTEAELVAGYYLMRNIDMFCYYVLGIKIHPFQSIILRTLLRKPFVMLLLTRGGGKTFTLGVYAAIRACLTPGCKVVMLGANRRQSRFIFAESSKIYWNNKAPLFKEMVPRPPNDLPEQSTMIVRGMDQESTICAFPMAAGDRIRGIRSSHLLIDEFNLIPQDIFQTVLKPTAAVALNPVDKVEKLEKERALIEIGAIRPEDAMEFEENQVVVSSSASYQFTFMYKLYCEYKEHILKGIDTDDIVLRKNASKYAIIQLGCDSIMEVAKGYLNETTVESDRKSFPSDKFQTEYGAQFVSDSGGFIPRSLLETRQLKVGEQPMVEIAPKDGDIYILGIDPSSGQDAVNDWFAIVLLKVDAVKRTCYVVNASASSGKGWPYYVNLVRQYIRVFRPRYIICDSFGGGSQLASLLCSPEYTDKTKGDVPLHIIDKDDLMTYSHGDNRILRMNIPTNQFNEQSNLHLKSVLEHGQFWFGSPLNEDVYKSFTANKMSEKEFDSLENSSEKIEEAKSQISLIVGSQGSNGLTTFNMADGLTDIKKKERKRKDLYSATLLAAWGAKEFFSIIDGNQSTQKPYNPTIATV